MKCNVCGKELDQDTIFCKYCGAKVDEVEASKNKNEVIAKDNSINNSKASIGKRKSKNSILKIGSIMVVIGTVIFVVFFMTKTPVDKYFSMIDNGNSTGANELFREKIEGNKSEESAVKTEVSKQIHSIKDDFISGKIDFETAKIDINKYADIYGAYTEYRKAKNDIDGLNISLTSFSKGEEHEKSGDIFNAIKAYNDVVKEDANFDLAQSKIDSLKAEYIVTVVKDAEKLESSSKYKDANDILNQALRIIEDESILEAKVKTNETKIAESKKKEEAARKEKLKLHSGKMVSSNGFDVTYKKAEFTAEIKPDNRSGSYIYYEAENHEIFFDLIFTVKNNSNHSLTTDDIFTNIDVTYDNSYSYSTYSTFYSIGDNISNANWGSIDPLVSVTYHLAIKLPREVSSNSKPLSVTFDTLGEKQYLNFR